MKSSSKQQASKRTYMTARQFRMFLAARDGILFSTEAKPKLKEISDREARHRLSFYRPIDLKYFESAAKADGVSLVEWYKTQRLKYR